MARKRHKRKSKLGKEQTKKEHRACCRLDLSHLFKFKEPHHNARRMQERGKSKKGSKAVKMKRCVRKCSIKINGARKKDLSIHDVPKASLEVEENKARSAPDKSYGSNLTKILGADEMSNECYEASPPTTISSSIPATQFYSFCDEEAGETAGPELVIDNASSTFSIHLDHEMEMFAGRRSVSSLEYRHWNSHSERSYATNSGSYSRHTELGELGKQLLAKHAVLQKKLDEAKKAILNNNYSGAKELAKDLIFHQSKDFLEALEMYNINREQVLVSPQTQTAKHVHEPQSFHEDEAAHYSSTSLSGTDMSPSDGKDSEHTIHGNTLLTAHWEKTQETDSPIESERTNETKDDCSMERRAANYSSPSLSGTGMSPSDGKDSEHTIHGNTLLTAHGEKTQETDSPIESEWTNETKDDSSMERRADHYSSPSLSGTDMSPSDGKNSEHTMHGNTFLTAHGEKTLETDSSVESKRTNETKDDCIMERRVHPPSSVYNFSFNNELLTKLPQNSVDLEKSMLERQPSEEDEEAAYCSSSLGSVDTLPGHGKDWKHTVNRSTLLTEHGEEIHDVDSPIESEHTNETKDECNTAKRVYPPTSTTIAKPNYETTGNAGDLNLPSSSSNELRCKKKSGKGATTRLRDIKRRLKYAIALKKGKREQKNISMDGIPHKVPYGSNDIRRDALDQNGRNAICRWTGEHEKTSNNSCISSSSNGQELRNITDIRLSIPESDWRYNNPTLNTDLNADEEPALESFGEESFPKLSSQETVSEGNCITESYKKEPHVQICDSRTSRYQKPNKGNDVSSELNRTVNPLQESEVLHATNAKGRKNKANHKHSCWKCHRSHGSLEMDSILNPLRESEKVKRGFFCWKCHRSHGNLELDSTLNPLQKSEVFHVTSTKGQKNEVKPKTSCWNCHRAHDSSEMDNITNPLQESEVLHAISTKNQKNKVKTKLSCWKCHKSHGSLKMDSTVYPVQDSEILQATNTEGQNNAVKTKVNPKRSFWNCHRSYGSLKLDSTLNALQKSEISHATNAKGQCNEVKTKFSRRKCRIFHC